MKFFTAWGRHNKCMISKKSLEDNPLVAFAIGIIEAQNEYEAEEKAKEIMRNKFAYLLKDLGN